MSLAFFAKAAKVYAYYLQSTLEVIRFKSEDGGGAETVRGSRFVWNTQSYIPSFLNYSSSFVEHAQQYALLKQKIVCKSLFLYLV